MDRTKIPILLLLLALTLSLWINSDESLPGVANDGIEPMNQAPITATGRTGSMSLASSDSLSALNLSSNPGSVKLNPDSPQPGYWYPELKQIAQLENLPPSKAVPELEVLISHPDPVVRHAALEALGDMRSSVVPSLLTRALADDDPYLRITALEGLAAQAGIGFYINVERYLWDSDAEVRIAAIEALAELENPDSVHSLAGLLSDEDTRVRRHAVIALGEIGGESALLYLREARYDVDARVRANAETIIAELEYDAAN